MSKKITKSVPKLRFSEFVEDWQEKRLENLFSEFKSGFNITSEDIAEHGTYPVFGGNGVRGYVESFTHDGIYFLIGRQGALCGNINRINGKAYISEHAIACKANDQSDTEWLAQRLDYYNLNKLSESSAQPGLSVNKLLRFKLFVPSIAEQEKIASFLGAIDKRLTQLRRKHELLQTYKRGVIREIFIHKIGSQKNKKTPSFRFNSFAGEWQPRKFKEFIVKKNTNASENIPLYSLTIENGVTEKTERYERSFLIKSEDEAYKLVESNDFVYNPMNVRLGALGRHKKDYSVKVSKYYDVFSLDQSVDINFVEFLLKNRNSIQYYDHMAAGSLIEKKRLHFVDFLQFTFLLPCIEEQEKIADFLTAIDQKIEAVARQVDRTEQFKKGLLQKMFV